MSMPKPFEEFVKTGIIKKCSINKARADFLLDESKNSLNGLYERVDIIGINEKNTNSIIKDCYDILMELVRANLLLAGYNSAGQFAHEGEISYLKKLGFSESDISFLNDLRYFRNSVTYYGKILDKEYATKVFAFTKKLYPKLRALVK